MTFDEFIVIAQLNGVDVELNSDPIWWEVIPVSPYHAIGRRAFASTELIDNGCYVAICELNGVLTWTEYSWNLKAVAGINQILGVSIPVKEIPYDDR